MRAKNPSQNRLSALLRLVLLNANCSHDCPRRSAGTRVIHPDVLHHARDPPSVVEITTYVPIASVPRRQLADAHGRPRLENTTLVRVSYSVSRSPNKKSQADGIIPHTSRGRILSRITARERSAGCTAGTGYPVDSSIKIISVRCAVSKSEDFATSSEQILEKYRRHFERIKKRNVQKF